MSGINRTLFKAAITFFKKTFLMEPVWSLLVNGR